MQPSIERRFTASPAAPTLRSAANPGSGSVLTGYGAVFYRPGDPATEYRLAADVVERIRPGAFDRALLERQDVVGLFNHDANELLGRTSSGTVRLSADANGLRYQIDLPAARADIAELAARGDLTGSSFGFIARTVKYEDDRSTGDIIRWLVDVDLIDVSVVVHPAYSGATAELTGPNGILAQARESEAIQVAMTMLAIQEERLAISRN